MDKTQTRRTPATNSRKLADNRISGTTSPLHDERADVYQNGIEVISAL